MKKALVVSAGLAMLATTTAFADVGNATYKKACFACHNTGAAGSPKLGDKAAWADRIKKGMATLEEHAIKGFKAMPPKGGRADLSDADVKAAVAYMVKNSQ